MFYDVVSYTPDRTPLDSHQSTLKLFGKDKYRVSLLFYKFISTRSTREPVKLPCLDFFPLPKPTPVLKGTVV